eukprot:NODE_791_length_4216_cov_0.181686.p2 type:complete len:200 gc:universal NODE_791_length_4216_cov_0.181686:1274-675(-)
MSGDRRIYKIKLVGQSRELVLLLQKAKLADANNKFITVVHNTQNESKLYDTRLNPMRRISSVNLALVYTTDVTLIPVLQTDNSNLSRDIVVKEIIRQIKAFSNVGINGLHAKRISLCADSGYPTGIVQVCNKHVIVLTPHFINDKINPCCAFYTDGQFEMICAMDKGDLQRWDAHDSNLFVLNRSEFLDRIKTEIEPWF